MHAMTSLGSDWLSIAVSCVLMVAMVQGQASMQITCPADKNENTGPNREVLVTWTTPTNAHCTPSSGSMFPIGVSSVVCSNQDPAANEAPCRFLVTVKDNQPPDYTKCPKPIRKVITDFNPLSPVPTVSVSWDKTAASDNSGSFDEFSTHQENSMFPLGVTSVKYTASDNSGNTKACEFAVSVAVKPPNNHTFTEDITSTSFTVAWPELDNEGFYALIWNNNEDKPDVSNRRVLDSQGATYHKADFKNLSPGELYNVEINNEEDDYVVSTIQQWTDPSPPQNVVFEPISPSSARLSWSPGEGNVQEYRVGVSEIHYVSMETTSIMVENLRPGGAYSGFVEARAGSRAVNTLTANAVVTAPLNQSQLYVYNYTESTIDVAWLNMFPGNSGTSDLEPYMVFINPEDAVESYQTIPTESTNQTAHFEGLMPNKDYQILVISNLGMSLQVSQTTRPGRVRNIQQSEVLSDSITLEWEPPSDAAADGYCYEVYQSPGKPYEPIDVLMGTSYTFTSLTNGTVYHFEVYTKTNCPDGIRSVQQSVTVTAGNGGAVQLSPATKNMIIVGATLGAFVLLLAVILVITCIMYQRAKSPRNLPNLGQTNKAMKDNEPPLKMKSPGKKFRQVDVNEDDDMYETPEPDQAESSSSRGATSSHYQNAPPVAKGKPKVTRR